MIIKHNRYRIQCVKKFNHGLFGGSFIKNRTIMNGPLLTETYWVNFQPMSYLQL